MNSVRDTYTCADRSAVRPLEILLVGAGITGLSTALALAKTGHSVTVFEFASEIKEVGAGIQIPPNASRILKRLGVLDELVPLMSFPSKASFRRYDSDDEIGSSPMMPELGQKYGAPAGIVHRADLQRVLLHAALGQGCRILTSHSVVAAHPSFRPRILVLDRQTGARRWWDADVVIAADGIKSTLRKQITTAIGFQDDPIPTGDAAYRLLIPRERIQHDPALLEMLNQNEAVRYMGPGGHVVGYPLRGNMLYNMVLVHPDESDNSITDRDCWITRGDRAKMLAFYSSWSPKIRAWISYADESVLDWSLNTYKPLPCWVHGYIALAGDACHPMLPYVAQGAASGIEDAASLARIFTHTDNVPLALSLYQKVRKERAERLAASASDTGRYLHLRDGPEQQQRDRQIIHQNVNNRTNDRWRDSEWQDFMFNTDVMRDIDENWEALVDSAPRQS
ncbi:hypothetical protein B0I35DRAFT_360568 [Stachybotrys elegans]|uniref:FAD-binding domain-containing protein n=1 Tax=Stachybotrys elegans TaxID=80388 RepID=A0A8K0WLD6_9HYPO|nr:hypothetical protein B0I35DRAFT_360568 [Stachybotrys elegans]